MRPLRPRHSDRQESHDIRYISVSYAGFADHYTRAHARIQVQTLETCPPSGVTTLDCDEVQPQYIRRQALLQTLDFETGWIKSTKQIA